MVTVCPKCGHECIESQVAVICPNCDYLTMKKIDWKGDKTECPKCKSEARVYKHQEPGKSFVCDNCKTIGRFFGKIKYSSKVIQKESSLGKRLTWLFEVPCEHWRKRESFDDSTCQSCDMKNVCAAHSEEIQKLCRKKGVEVYMHKDYIEVIHS
jgi:hypothetical protein